MEAIRDGSNGKDNGNGLKMCTKSNNGRWMGVLSEGEEIWVPGQVLIADGWLRQILFTSVWVHIVLVGTVCMYEY